MSEYQYYEFRAVDRPLTRKQMEALRRYSSRAQITSGSFVNVYNWGNFRGDPLKLVEEYFDAFLYLANWGTRRLVLRMPENLLLPKAEAYGAGNSFSCHQKGNHAILSFLSEEVEDEWTEGEGWLASLVLVRATLMRGDHRALYLGWLLGVQAEEVDDDALEPAVPPGLRRLDAPLTRLVDFLRIDRDLIAAAAEQSTAKPNTSRLKKKIGDWISKLTVDSKDSLLAMLIAEDDPYLVAELQLQVLRATTGAESNSSVPPRSAADLLDRARVLGETRREKDSARRARQKAERERKAAARRKKHIESLMGEEGSLWNRVDQLIDTRLPKCYDETVDLLRDLRDLAEMSGDTNSFTARLADLHTDHARKTSLQDRLRKAKL